MQRSKEEIKEKINELDIDDDKKIELLEDIEDSMIVKVESEDEKDGTDFDVTATETEQGSGEIEHGDINTPYDPKLDLESYQYPTMDLIASSEDSTPAIDMAEQNANKDSLK